MKCQMSLSLGHKLYIGHQVKLKKYLVGALEATNFCSLDLKIDQNVCFDRISDELKFGSPGVSN